MIFFRLRLKIQSVLFRSPSTFSTLDLVMPASCKAAGRVWSRAIFDDPDNKRLLIKAATR